MLSEVKLDWKTFVMEPLLCDVNGDILSQTSASAVEEASTESFIVCLLPEGEGFDPEEERKN